MEIEKADAYCYPNVESPIVSSRCTTTTTTKCIYKYQTLIPHLCFLTTFGTMTTTITTVIIIIIMIIVGCIEGGG